MKKLMPLWAVLLPPLFAGLYYYSGPVPTSQLILGKWYEQMPESGTLIFFANGHALEHRDRTESERWFEYTIGDESHTRFQWAGDASRRPYVRDYTLTFRGNDSMFLRWNEEGHASYADYDRLPAASAVARDMAERQRPFFKIKKLWRAATGHGAS